jgi:outer membrane protein assembly factor BamD
MAPGARVRRAIAAAALTALSACASSQLNMETLSSASDDVVYEAGVKASAKKDYEAARQYYRRLVEAFPQSPHQADARIGLADSYFDEGGTGNYVLAVSSYREFLTLYPQHPRSDYAQFKAAESYFEQKNSPDRDQTATMQALEEYERLLDVYPQSQYVEKARERIRDCRQTLARSHFQVGYFYQRTRKSWRSAIGRYQTILNDYPDFERIDEVLYRMGQVLSFQGRYAEARPHLARLRNEFPQSAFVPQADELEKTFPASVPAAPSTAPAGPPPNPAGSSSPPPQVEL